MSNNKQTAVEWLVEQCFPIMRNTPPLSQIIEQAKQMEKEQIIDAWEDGYDNAVVFRAGWQQYYEFKYGKGNQPI